MWIVMHIPMCFYIVGMHLYNHYAGQGLQHLSYSMRPPCVSSKIIVTTTTLTLKDSLLISVIEELCRSRNLQTSITLNHLLHSSLCVVSSEVSPSLCVTSALFFIYSWSLIEEKKKQKNSFPILSAIMNASDIHSLTMIQICLSELKSANLY